MPQKAFRPPAPAHGAIAASVRLSLPRIDSRIIRPRSTPHWSFAADAPAGGRL